MLIHLKSMQVESCHRRWKKTVYYGLKLRVGARPGHTHSGFEEQHEEMTKAKQIADQAKTDYEDVQKNEDILKDDLKDARAKLLAAEDERHELEKVQASHETIVQRLQEEHELENREIKKVLRNEKKLVAELQEENERMRDNTQVGACKRSRRKLKTL